MTAPRRRPSYSLGWGTLLCHPTHSYWLVILSTTPRDTPVTPSQRLMLPVDALGRSARALQEGGEMRGNTFVTKRGDQISRPHGRCPQQGWIGGPYPRIDEVSEGI